MSQSNLSKFFIGPHRRVSHIIRFNTTPHFFNETVAEHTFYVALYTVILKEFIESKTDEKFDFDKCISLSLVHDLEECFTGDIVKTIKEKMEDEFDRISLGSLSLVFSGLNDDLSSRLTDIWKERFTKSKEFYLVYIADSISSIVYALGEVEMGNIHMKEIVENNLNRIKKIPYAWGEMIYDELSDLRWNDRIRENNSKV